MTSGDERPFMQARECASERGAREWRRVVGRSRRRSGRTMLPSRSESSRVSRGLAGRTNRADLAKEHLSGARTRERPLVKAALSSASTWCGAIPLKRTLALPDRPQPDAIPRQLGHP